MLFLTFLSFSLSFLFLFLMRIVVANFQEFVSNVLQKPHVFVHRFSLVHYSFPAFFRNFPFAYVNLSRPFDTFLSIHVTVSDACLSRHLASLTVRHAFVPFCLLLCLLLQGYLLVQCCFFAYLVVF